MNGIVFKSTGSWYIVQDNEGQFWESRIKGKLKIDNEISSTNPVAVGDVVEFDIENEDTRTGIIKSIADRHNYMIRVSPHNHNQKHIIASNIDIALLIATITEPRTSTGFIDRFLLTAEAYHIPAIIAINKTDLLKPKQQEILQHWTAIYTRAGYPVYPVVAREPASLHALMERLKDKITLFSGHSGVGKSTLINSMLPGMELKTSEISAWSGKGLHTTTFAEMHLLPGGGKIIDTPGVKEFGLIDIEKKELSQFFPEMRPLIPQCKFTNCLHQNEPGCAVIAAAEAGKIAEERYYSYLSILDTIVVKW